MNQGPDYGGTQDRGGRNYQEDAFHIRPLPGAAGEQDGVLMVIADGMGGHVGGRHASAAAVEAFTQAYASVAEPEGERLRHGLLAANQRLARDVAANPALRGMGCTLIGASLLADGLRFVSVGDSVVFLFRDGALSRLNADHSMVPVLEQAVQLGELSGEELASHPNRNALRSAVTGREPALVDLHDAPKELLPGDRLVLASDGILTLDPPQLAQLIGQHAEAGAEALSRILVEAVIGAGNPHQDNVTVLLAAMPAAAPASAVPGPGTARHPPGWQGARSLARRLLQPRVLAVLGIACLAVAGAQVVEWLPRPTWLRPAAAPVPATPPLAKPASPEATSPSAAGPDASVGGANTGGAESGRPSRPGLP